VLSYVGPCSAGFAGAFIDKEVETRGVRRQDISTITLPIHAVYYSSIVSTKRRLSTKVCSFPLKLVASTAGSDRSYSPQESGESFVCRRSVLLDVGLYANHGCVELHFNETACKKCIQSTISFRTCETVKRFNERACSVISLVNLGSSTTRPFLQIRRPKLLGRNKVQG
jgi:hypothetical protein